MKTSLLAALCCCLGLCAAGLPSFADEAHPPMASALFVLDAGLNQAKASSRNVFLLYGFPACAPCKLFENYLASPEVKPIFEKYYVLVKIDTVNMEDGWKLQAELGPEGAAAWAILNPARRVIIDSDDGTGGVGFPSDPRGVRQFLKALKTSSPNITEAELAKLVAPLKNAALDAGGAQVPTAQVSAGPAAETGKSPAGGKPRLPAADDDVGLKTVSKLNAPGKESDGVEQATMLGIALIAGTQRALVGTWTDGDVTVEISTTGVPPVALVKLGSETARLHLVWDVDAMTAHGSAFAVLRWPQATQALTFQLVDGTLHLQQVTVFTQQTGQVNSIQNKVLKKAP